MDWIDPSNKHLHPFNFSDLARPTHISTPEPQPNRCSHVPAVSNAYADDLATITTGPPAYLIQQQQATWISAFCAFTGLQLNMQKIAPVSIGAHASTMPRYITVYNHKWQPTHCPIQRSPTNLSYLGLRLDHIITNHHKQALFSIRMQITTLLEHLLDQPGPVNAKLDYIRFKILPIVLHTAQCSNWSLSHYRTLDVPFNIAYKTIPILPTHFPTTLLYLPTDYGGIGLPRFSDRAQVMKWRAFHRSLAVGHQPAQAVNDLLHRLPTQTHLSLPLVHHKPLSLWRSHTKLIARSMGEWLAESGFTAAYTTALTEAQTIARDRNAISLDRVAKLIHLRFDPEIHDPDLPVFPLKFYVTDGSFNSTSHPRRIQHIKAHPERDPIRMTNPSPLDSAIFLADAIAGDTTTKFGRNHINHIAHSLILEDIIPEIIPLRSWHLRNVEHMDIPVLDLSMDLSARISAQALSRQL